MRLRLSTKGTYSAAVKNVKLTARNTEMISKYVASLAKRPESSKGRASASS